MKKIVTVNQVNKSITDSAKNDFIDVQYSALTNKYTSAIECLQNVLNFHIVIVIATLTLTLGCLAMVLEPTFKELQNSNLKYGLLVIIALNVVLFICDLLCAKSYKGQKEHINIIATRLASIEKERGVEVMYSTEELPVPMKITSGSFVFGKIIATISIFECSTWFLHLFLI